MIGVNILLLVIVMLATWYGSKALGFNHADRITIMFCGSKKSLASGAPMASAIFAGANVGSVVLPLMLFHQIQLMACAVIARKLADHKPAANTATAAAE
jgi:sodium/bile acid cotransporter 7